MIRRDTCLVLAFLLASTTMAAADNPRYGTWKQNLAKSTYNPGPKPTSPTTIRIEPSGQGEKVSIQGYMNGNPIAYSYVASADGQAFATPGSPYGDKATMKNIDDRTTELTYTRGGKVSRTSKRAISADGKTMTITASGVNAKGEKYQTTSVLEKQ